MNATCCRSNSGGVMNMDYTSRYLFRVLHQGQLEQQAMENRNRCRSAEQPAWIPIRLPKPYAKQSTIFCGVG